MVANLPVPTLDPASFEGWYTAVFPRVFGYAMKVTGGDRRVAENVTQETFLQAVRRIRTQPGEPVPLPWLFTVVRSRVIDEARRRGRLDRKVVRLRAERPRAVARPGEPDPSELLAPLPALERTALALRYVDDLPVAEVAAALGKSVRATESLLARARRRLRDHLGEDDDA